MNSSNLIPDCIAKIIKYLENDIKSIYCCIFINKSWFYTTVPFLWRNPFEIVSNETFIKASNLIQTYISCLPDDDKLHLIYDGFNISKAQTAFFDYPSCIKEINCNLVNKSISVWINETYFKHEAMNEEKENLFIGKIYNMFFSKYSRLLNFEIGSRRYGSFKQPNFSSFSELRHAIINLQHLGIYFHSSDLEQIDEQINEEISKFFKKLLIYQCHDLYSINYKSCENIDILAYYDEGVTYYKISELIKLQRGLRWFRYLVEPTSILHLEESSSIFDALKTKVNSLTHLELRGMKFNDKIIQSLKLFKSLKILIIIGCHDELTENLFPEPGQLSITKFVFLNNKNMRETSQVGFLKLPNYNLKSLTTDLIDNKEVINSLNYQFPNIIYLSIRVERNGFVQMDWISELTKLTHLILDVSFNVLSYLTSSHIYNFGLSLPMSLKVLHIDNEHFPPSVLDNLLKACDEKNIPLETLGLHFDYKSRINELYLSTILKYVSKDPNDGLIGLKELRIGFGLKKNSLEGIFSEKHLETVKENIPIFTNENEYSYWYWHWLMDEYNTFGHASLINV